MSAEVLVLGIGSPFGADRLGWMAVEALAGQGFGSRFEVDLESCDRPGVTLLEYLRGRRHAILIDALIGGLAPGTIRRLTLDELRAGSTLSNHGFGVADALALGGVLGELPEKLTVIGIEAGEGEEPPPVAWDELYRLVAEAIARGE